VETLGEPDGGDGCGRGERWHGLALGPAPEDSSGAPRPRGRPV
jgi:hypothetical protein